MKLTAIFLTVVLVSSGTEKAAIAQSTPEPEAMSFSGTPLYAKIAEAASIARADSLITVIRSKSTLIEEDYIAIGRTQVSINRFKKAIETYSEGLAKYPNSFRLLRHRGHRYINLRQLEKAIVDLNKSEELIRKEPETYEYDAAGKPGATYQHQIWYHIGLYHFLKREYGLAATAFEKSVATAHAGNDLAGASDWLYNCYMRYGAKEKAAAVLKPFTLEFVIEPKDYPYFRRLLLFKGLIKPEELVDVKKPIGEMTLLEMTKLYGLANWHYYKGDQATANAIYMNILQSREWAGFAYACAELDVKK